MGAQAYVRAECLHGITFGLTWAASLGTLIGGYFYERYGARVMLIVTSDAQGLKSLLHAQKLIMSSNLLAFTLGRVDSKLYGSPSPVSALKELDPQNALDLGVFAFELPFEHQSARLNGQVSTVRQTHAGVLEIVVNEGNVWLPPIVAALLYKRTKELPDSVQMRFVRLEKGKFASLQLRGKGLAIMGA
ncbi:unnamed protein product [Peronospora belbahrii]|uniref:Uncharacterized protein n=1 Tax=Peronospora belbahrii TaxID=622444 RepID=A0AAU9L5Q2_9STRA|nr:unnamed protein product [Peronospora belbahrii]